MHKKIVETLQLGLITAVKNGNLGIVEDLLKNGADVNILDNSFFTESLLHSAVRMKQVQMAKLLINYGANVNVADFFGNTPIGDAIQKRDTKMIELLLTNGANIKEDPKVLCIAVKNENLEIVEELLKNGADVNMLHNSYLRESLLHSAVERKQVRMTKLLINYGANVNIKDIQGKTPIVDAIQNRDTKMIELLLTNGADIKEDFKVLRTAVKNGNLGIVEELLKNGADVNMLDNLSCRGSLLHSAAREKQVQMAKLLINYGANVNVADFFGNTPIVAAIQKRDTKMIELLLTNGANIKEDPKVLCIAVKNENLEIVEELLKNGADVNMLDNSYHRESLLHSAVERKQVQMAKQLIHYGANVNVKNVEGQTPIVVAILNGDTKMIELLLTNGADITKDPKVLRTAISYGNLDIVEDLLKNGADVNMLDNSYLRESLLHSAVRRYHVHMAKLLINYGANVNIKDVQGNTPIVKAIQNRDIRMIELFLTNGADINRVPKLICTAIKNENLKIVEELLKNGADVNMLDNLSCRGSLLHAAVERKQVQMAKLLIHYGANVNVKNVEGETPIVVAILNGDTKMIELLLTNGADINKDPKVLHTAIKFGNLKIVEKLLKNGADVNMLDNSPYRDSLLHSAVERKQVRMAKLLINYGANVNVEDIVGNTPIVDAIQNWDIKMIELLLTNGADIKEDLKVLRTAVKNGNLGIVEELLKNGADVNMLDNLTCRGSLLHSAAKRKQVQMAKLLINYGANVNIKDIQGNTPIVDAIQNRDIKMIKLLLINGADIKVHPNLQRVKCLTSNLLKQHIAKVKAAGLYVSERNLWWISRDYKISNFLNKCDAEVQIMKRKKIDNSSASFYDILTKNTSELAKNESIVNALKSDDYKTKFPIYASTIDSRFRRGVEREQLMEQVRNKFLPSLFESLIELPFLCTEKIFSYLSDRDLRILLVACKLFNK